MIMVISPNKRHMEQLARAQARESASPVEAEPVATGSETDEG
jgi:hypothetical protein